MLKITRENPLKNLTRQRRINIKDLNNWNNIIEAVYTIRNNLFHGHKQHSRDRDNELVKAGYPILRRLNEILINNLKSKYQERYT